MIYLQGTDITELFESHHLNGKSATEVMHKFFVGKAKSPRNSPFTFEPDGFYNVLKARANKRLSYVNRNGSSLKSMVVVDTYILVALALCVGVAQTQRYTLAIMAGITLGLGMVASHNFTHLKDNWRMYYVHLSLLSVRQVHVTFIYLLLFNKFQSEVMGGHSKQDKITENLICEIKIYNFQNKSFKNNSQLQNSLNYNQN